MGCRLQRPSGSPGRLCCGRFCLLVGKLLVAIVVPAFVGFGFSLLFGLLDVEVVSLVMGGPDSEVWDHSRINKNPRSSRSSTRSCPGSISVLQNRQHALTGKGERAGGCQASVTMACHASLVCSLCFFSKRD